MIIIPILDDTVETFTNRYAAPFAVDVTIKMACEQAPFSTDVQAGSGTIVLVDLLSDVLDAAR